MFQIFPAIISGKEICLNASERKEFLIVDDNSENNLSESTLSEKISKYMIL